MGLTAYYNPTHSGQGEEESRKKKVKGGKREELLAN